jgi:hypothetical protein
MRILSDLPDSLLGEIFSKWIHINDFAWFDSAYCEKRLRGDIMAVLVCYGCLFNDNLSVMKRRRHHSSGNNILFLDWIACRGLRLSSLSLSTECFASVSLTTRITTNTILTLTVTGMEMWFSHVAKVIFVDTINSMNNLINLELSEVYCCDFIWNGISSCIWQQLVSFHCSILHNKVILPPNFIEQVAERCNNLKHFVFCNCVLYAEFLLSESSFISLVGSCSKLCSLHLVCGGVCTTEMLIALHEKCLWLEDLHLVFSRSTISLNACVDLIGTVKKLFIGNRQEKIDNHMFQCFHSCSKSLRVTGFKDCNASMLRLFAHVKTGIINLRLTSCDGVNPNLMMVIANNNPTLEKIVIIGSEDLKFSSKMSSCAIIYLIEKCLNLSRLVLVKFVMSDPTLLISWYSAFDHVE